MSASDDFMTRGARIRGLTVRPSRFRVGHTTALWLGEREIGHRSDWILVRLRYKADVERALELLRRAMRA